MHHRINVYTLHLFATVAQEGSIVRAAAREHIAADDLARADQEMAQRRKAYEAKQESRH